MSLHRLCSVTVGVPDPGLVGDYYGELGLVPDGGLGFSTVDGGRQLLLTEAPTRRLAEMVIGVDGPEDLAAAESALAKLGRHADVDGGRLSAVEPVTGVRVILEVSPRTLPTASPPVAYNRPGHLERRGLRSPAVVRAGRVLPRKLGHVVVTTTDPVATSRFFVDGVGFKVSDRIGSVGVFLRCSTDHHNLLVLAAPAVYLHHTAWQLDDVDEVGRGATAMLEEHPERHVWGLGRHQAGSNFFWYLRDPAGNYSEYYADLDFIPEDCGWTPESYSGRFSLYNWGPVPPPEFLQPADVGEIAAAFGHVSA